MTRLQLTCSTAAFALLTATAAARDSARGTIERISAAAHTISVRTVEGKLLKLDLTPLSKIERAGEAFPRRQLEAGQRVKVTYRREMSDRTESYGNRLLTLTVRATTADDVSKEVKDALNAVRDYSYGQKDKYQARLADVIDDLDDRTDDLKRNAKAAAGDARKQYEQEIEALKVKRDALARRMDKVKSASADAWADVKAAASEALDELHQGLQKAWARFKEG